MIDIQIYDTTLRDGEQTPGVHFGPRQKLDIAIMNREGYDLCSQKGYLADLPSLLADDPALSEQVTPLLTENEVVLSDNSIDVMLKVAEEEVRVTQSVPNALSLSSLPLFHQAVFDSEIYLGILVNSQRTETALDYIRYLLSAGSAQT